MIMKNQKSQWLALSMTALGIVLTLSTWFSTTSVAGEISVALTLNNSQIAWLTNAVQGGFVIGAMISSLFALADIWPIKWLLSFGAICVGLANLLILFDTNFAIAVASRLATGASLAIVYPTAMKYISTWFIKSRGLAMGILVGALTIGSAFPHLINSFNLGLDWKSVIKATSLACFIAAAIFINLKDGPYQFKSAIFQWGQLSSVLKNRPVMLANFGYFGHMWEIYAFWGWFLAYSSAAQASGLDIENTSSLTFSVIAVGALGCIFGGILADRIGRCLTTALAMSISGLCAIMIGFLYDGPTELFVTVALIWGFSAIADSAQFSATVAEVSDPTLVGSSLTFQMGIGFSITVFVVWILPKVAEFLGSWQWAFSILAIGPVFGIWAMLTLRKHPDAKKIANGKR